MLKLRKSVVSRSSKELSSNSTDEEHGYLKPTRDDYNSSDDELINSTSSKSIGEWSKLNRRRPKITYENTKAWFRWLLDKALFEIRLSVSIENLNVL